MDKVLIINVLPFVSIPNYHHDMFVYVHYKVMKNYRLYYKKESFIKDSFTHCWIRSTWYFIKNSLLSFGAVSYHHKIYYGIR